jgi:Tol biopolymer transport system component
MPTFLKPYLVISMSLIVLLSSCVTARQSVTPDTHSHIAYLFQPDGAQEKHLSVLDFPSLNIVSLHTGLTHDGCPTWSSDGKQIMFIFGSEYELEERAILYKINLNDGRLSDVKYGEMPIGTGSWHSDVNKIAWSPDNRKLAYRIDRSGMLPLINIFDIETLDEYQLPKVGMIHLNPAWSPDGKQIAFSTNSSTPYNTMDLNYSIFVINLDGSGLLKLTDDQGHEYIGDNTLRDLAPSWSPDGKQIVFYTKVVVLGSSVANISIINVDGSHRTQITHDESPVENISPVWSPDGQWITFASNRDHPNKPGVFDIYTMKPDGSEIRKLTNSGNNTCPAWQP